MQTKTIDNRGLNCPEPVIRTKKALDDMTAGSLISLVDNEIAKENVLRLAKSLGLDANVNEKDKLFYIEISKGPGATPEPMEQSSQTDHHLTMLVQTDEFGQGDAELGRVLMKSFFHALNENDELPREIWFVNSGVRLTCQGSAVLERLQALEKQGVQIFSCGTCLDFYGLNDQLAIGEVTNMFSIVECLTKADKVITI